MDVLKNDDIYRAQQASLEEKLLQTLQLMKTAMELKRAQLRTRHPDLCDEEIEAVFDAWLVARE